MTKIQGSKEFEAMASADADNNSIFLDTSDDKLKLKDNSGNSSTLKVSADELVIGDFTTDIGDWVLTSYTRTALTAGQGIGTYGLFAEPVDTAVCTATLTFDVTDYDYISFYVFSDRILNNDGAYAKVIIDGNELMDYVQIIVGYLEDNPEKYVRNVEGLLGAHKYTLGLSAITGSVDIQFAIRGTSSGTVDPRWWISRIVLGKYNNTYDDGSGN